MQVAKWGNSLAVRLPASLVEKLRLKPGDNIALKPGGRGVMHVNREAQIDAAFERLRKFRGRLPADFKFDREEANRRGP